MSKSRRYLYIIVNTEGHINGQKQICTEGGNTCSINGDICFIEETEHSSSFGGTELCHLCASCTWLVFTSKGSSCMMLPFWEYPYLLNGKFQLNIWFQLNHKTHNRLDSPTNRHISTLLKLLYFVCDYLLQQLLGSWILSVLFSLYFQHLTNVCLVPGTQYNICSMSEWD